MTSEELIQTGQRSRAQQALAVCHRPVEKVVHIRAPYGVVASVAEKGEKGVYHI